MPRKRKPTGRPRGRPRGSTRYDDKPLLLAIALARFENQAPSDWAAAKRFSGGARSVAERLSRKYRHRQPELLAEARRIASLLREAQTAALSVAVRAEQQARELRAMAREETEAAGPERRVRQLLRDLLGEGTI
jgi:hypothetical protein